MAGTTPNFALPFPTGTDLVRDGDNAIQALAEAVDALLPRMAYGATSHVGAADAMRVQTVTYPTGRFTDVPVTVAVSRTSTAVASTTNTQVWIQSPAVGSMQVGVNRSNTTTIVVAWLSIQSGSGMTPAVAALLSTLGADLSRLAIDAAPLANEPATLADDATGMVAPTNATCRTPGCGNEGVTILVDMGFLDEDGNPHTVDGCTCGACGNPITDLVPYTPEPEPEGGE